MLFPLRTSDQVKGAFYSLVEPTPTGTEPQLVAFSPEVAAQIGLDPAEAQRPEFAAAMSGNAPMPNAAGCAEFRNPRVCRLKFVGFVIVRPLDGSFTAPGMAATLVVWWRCEMAAGLICLVA
jgi:hypothetical protein